jgi:hypothetical protein
MANKIDVKPFQEGLEELLDTDKKEPTVDSEAAGIRAEAEQRATGLARAIELVTCAVTILKLTRRALLALGDEDCTDWFIPGAPLDNLSCEIDDIIPIIQNLRR